MSLYWGNTCSKSEASVTPQFGNQKTGDFKKIKGERMKKVMIFPVIYIIVLLILGTLHLIWPKNFISLIKVTEIGLSWPVLLVMFLCNFIYIYYDPIYNYLNEMDWFKTRWLETSRQKKSATNNSKIKMAAYENIIDKLFEEKKGYKNKTMEKDKEIKLLRKKEADWIVAYANIFLEDKTKLILETIYNRERVDIESFNKLCLSMKIDQQEKNNIRSALKSLNFISIENNSLSIEPWGKYYVDYMKYIKQI